MQQDGRTCVCWPGGHFAVALQQERIVRNRRLSQGFAALVDVKIYLDVLTVPAMYVVPMFSTASGLFLHA